MCLPSKELTHGQWQDSSDDRDDLSSVMSDAPPDSGVLSSGITSPAVPPSLDPRTRVADLEQIREKLEAQLAAANKVRHVAIVMCAGCYGNVRVIQIRYLMW